MCRINDINEWLPQIPDMQSPVSAAWCQDCFIVRRPLNLHTDQQLLSQFSITYFHTLIHYSFIHFTRLLKAKSTNKSACIPARDPYKANPHSEQIACQTYILVTQPHTHPAWATKCVNLPGKSRLCEIQRNAV